MSPKTVRVRAAALTACVLAFSACGSGADTIAFNADDVEPVLIPDTLVDRVELDLSDDEARLVSVHSAWVCQSQTQTFADPGEIPIALAEHLVESGVDQADYDAFVAELPGRPDFRQANLMAVQENCFGR